MKFYVLKHPEMGYLCGRRGGKYFHEDLQKSRKFNRKCDAANCKAQGYYSYKTDNFEELMQSCQVEEIHYWVGKEVS